jgi:hypothetical protein
LREKNVKEANYKKVLGKKGGGIMEITDIDKRWRKSFFLHKDTQDAIKCENLLI